MSTFKFFVKALRFGLPALAVLLLIGTGPQPAHAQSQTTIPARAQVCIDAWDDAPASNACSGLSILRVGLSNAGDANNCSASGSCNITINVGGQPTTFDLYVTVNEPLSDFDTADVCFRADGTRYVVNVRAAGCQSDETTFSTAASTGLSAL